jgi:hypothetical protein
MLSYYLQILLPCHSPVRLREMTKLLQGVDDNLAKIPNRSLLNNYIFTNIKKCTSHNLALETPRYSQEILLLLRVLL